MGQVSEAEFEERWEEARAHVRLQAPFDADLLRRLILERNVVQKKLARIAGCSPVTVCHFLKKKRHAETALGRLAHALEKMRWRSQFKT